MAAQEGIPTLVVNQALHGDRFNSFIQSIGQPIVVLFDEFEKVYRARPDEQTLDGRVVDQFGRPLMGHNANQDSVLTLLDGVYPARVLFLLTVNDLQKITDGFLNRPGRVYYYLQFKGVSLDFIQECKLFVFGILAWATRINYTVSFLTPAYTITDCQDNLRDLSKTEEILAAAGLFDSFNFDMLQAMVQEMNLYGESAREVLKWLNVRPELASRGNFYVKRLTIEGNDISEDQRSTDWFGNPLEGTIRMKVQGQETSVVATDTSLLGSGDDVLIRELLSPAENNPRRVTFVAKEHLESVDTTEGIFTYKNAESEAELVLERKKEASQVDLSKVQLK